MTTPAHNFPGAAASRGTIRVKQALSADRGANSALAVHPRGHRLLSGWCGASSLVDLWALDRGQHAESLIVEAGLEDVGAHVHDALLPAGAEPDRATWAQHILPIVDASPDRHGEHVVLAAGRGVHLYRWGDGDASLRPWTVLRGHEQPVTRVALDASGERALSSDGHGRVVVWSTHGERVIHQLRISKVPTNVAFIWNDMLAMATDDTGRVICWELEHGRRHLQFRAHEGAVVSTSFNSDSGVLVTAGADNTARLWNLELGQQIGADLRHRGPIHDVTFANAGRFVVTAGADGNVAIWNSTDGDLIDWYFDAGPVYRVATDPLSGTLIVAGARSVKVLDVDWQGLRKLDADARAQVVDLSPADHAAMFAHPPSRAPVTYTGPSSADAPVGAVLAARQTTDLPFPDRSNLVIQRAQDAADPFAAPTVAPTQAMASIPEATSYGPAGSAVTARAASAQASGARSFGSAAHREAAPGGAAAAPRAQQPAAPASAYGTQAFGALTEAPLSFADGGHASASPGVASPGSASPAATVMLGGLPTDAGPGAGSLTAFASPAAGASPSPRTSYGMTGKTAAIDRDDDQIDAFFTSSSVSRHTKMESGMLEPPGDPARGMQPAQPARSAARAPDAPAAPPSAPASEPERAALRAAFGDAAEQRTDRLSVVRRRLGVGFAVLLGVLALVWVGTRTYFTVEAFPRDVEAHASEAHAAHASALAVLDEALDTFVDEEEGQIRSYERSGTLSGAELERVRARIQRRITERREASGLARERADLELAARIAELDEVRSVEATDLANRAAGAAGLLTLLLAGLWVGQAVRS